MGTVAPLLFGASHPLHGCRNSQLELLQSLVPGVQGRQVGEVEVLEETTR